MADCATGPPSIDNGRYVTTGTTSPYVDGARVIYSCNTGYTISGPADSVHCLNGTWTGLVPSCGVINANSEPFMWLAVGLASFIGLLLIIFLILACLYCCTRSSAGKSTVVQVHPTNDPEQQAQGKSKSKAGKDGRPHIIRVRSAGTQMGNPEGVHSKALVPYTGWPGVSNGSHSPPAWMPPSKAMRDSNTAPTY